MKDDSIKERIIDSCRDTFFANGLTRVTMDGLANQLGISKKTMYKYFPSKDNLVDTIVDQYLSELSLKIEKIVNAKVEYLEKLHDLWSFMAQVYSHVSKQCQDDVRKCRPDLWNRIEEFRRRSIRANFSKLIDEGMRLGVLRRDLNKEILVLIYLNAIQGVINPEVLMHHSFSGAEAYRTIIGVIFDGILVDAERTKYRDRFASTDSPPTLI